MAEFTRFEAEQVTNVEIEMDQAYGGSNQVDGAAPEMPQACTEPNVAARNEAGNAMTPDSLGSNDSAVEPVITPAYIAVSSLLNLQASIFREPSVLYALGPNAERIKALDPIWKCLEERLSQQQPCLMVCKNDVVSPVEASALGMFPPDMRACLRWSRTMWHTEEEETKQRFTEDLFRTATSKWMHALQECFEAVKKECIGRICVQMLFAIMLLRRSEAHDSDGVYQFSIELHKICGIMLPVVMPSFNAEVASLVRAFQSVPRNLENQGISEEIKKASVSLRRMWNSKKTEREDMASVEGYEAEFEIMSNVWGLYQYQAMHLLEAARSTCLIRMRPYMWDQAIAQICLSFDFEQTNKEDVNVWLTRLSLPTV